MCSTVRRPLVLSSVALAILVEVSGCTVREVDALAEAKARVAQRRPEKAEGELKRLLVKFPNSGEGRYLLGKLYLDRGDLNAARAEFERARALAFNDVLVAPALARTLIANGAAAEVPGVFGQVALADAAAMAELQAALSQAHMLRNEPKLAQDWVDKALATKPDSEPALLQQARLAATSNQGALALQRLDSLIERNPASAEAWALKGDVLLARRAPLAEAENALRKAITLGPELSRPRIKLLAMELAAGRITEARRDLEGLRKLSPNSVDTVYFDALVSSQMGDLKRAHAAYQELLKAAPTHILGLTGAADVEGRLRAYAQAAALAGKAMSLAPTNVNARLVLARIQLLQGQAAPALETLAPLLSGPAPQPYALALAAEARLSTGDAEGADALYVRLKQLKPEEPQLRLTMAMAELSKVGGTEAALSTLQELAAQDHASTADLALIGAYMRARQWPQAMQAIDSLQKKRPQDALPDHLRAQVARQDGKPDAARAFLEAALKKEPRYTPAVLGLADLELTQGQAEAARLRLERASKEQPGNVDLLLALAEVSRQSGRPLGEVRQILDRAVAADPGSTAARLAIIDHLRQRGDLRGALAAAQAAATSKSDNVKLLLPLGALQRAVGQYDQAVATAAQVTALAPQSIIGPLLRAEAQLGAGNLQDAERSVQQVLKRSPNSLDAQAISIALAIHQRQYPRGLRVAKQVQQQRPEAAVGWLLEGEVLMDQRQWDSAARAFGVAMSRRDPGAAAIKQHQALTLAHRDADAQTLAARWLKDHPKDAIFLTYLGEAAHQAGQMDDAERHYRAALDASPGMTATQNNLAMLLVQTNRPGAMALVETALAATPDDPLLLDTKAQVLAADSKLDQAIQVQQRAVSLAPAESGLRLTLTKLLLQAGKRLEARAELRRLQTAANGRMSESQRREADELRSKLTS